MSKTKLIHRSDYLEDNKWYEVLKEHGFISIEYCDIFDRDGEVGEEFHHLFRESCVLEVEA